MKTKYSIFLAAVAIAASPLLSAADPGTNAGFKAPASFPAKREQVPERPVKLLIGTGPEQGMPLVSGAAPTAPRQLLTDGPQNRGGHFYRKAKEAIDNGNLVAARYLYVHDVNRGAQLRVMGGPISPIDGENAGDQLQPRFPLLTIVW